MYSPKLREDLIRKIYRLARQEGKPMTQLVDEILRPEIERRGIQGTSDPDCTPEILKKTPDER